MTKVFVEEKRLCFFEFRKIITAFVVRLGGRLSNDLLITVKHLKQIRYISGDAVVLFESINPVHKMKD